MIFQAGSHHSSKLVEFMLRSAQIEHRFSLTQTYYIFDVQKTKGISGTIPEVMTFLPQYYRRYQSSKNELEKSIGSIKNKTETYEKIEKTLDSIYSSSKSLQGLKFKDTCSLSSFLSENDIELSPLFKSSGQKSLTSREADNDSMDIDTDAKGTDGDGEDEESALALTREQLHRHITLKALSEKPPLLVLGVTNLPGDILEYAALVENVLAHSIRLLNDCVPSCTRIENGEKVMISPGFQWSYMGVENLDSQTLYVSFDDAMMLYLFLKTMDSLDLGDRHEKTHVFGNKELEGKVFSKLDETFEVDLEKLSSVKEDVKKHILEIAKIGSKAKAKNTPADDYLTKFKRLSETYRVDPKDLSDVPADMLEAVKQNIIDFRLHVLTDLENKQKERMLKDKLEAQKQMGEPSNGASANSIHSERNYNRNGYSEYGNRNGMSDIEFESMLQNREKSALEKNYYIKLGQYKKKEDARLKQYKNFQLIQKHEAYISKVIPQNRKRFLDNFVSNVKDSNNKIDSNFNYYTKHANYAQYREKVKVNEEKKDLLDIEEETREEEVENAETLDVQSSKGVEEALSETVEQEGETQKAEQAELEKTEEVVKPAADVKMDVDDPSKQTEQPEAPPSEDGSVDHEILKIIHQNPGTQVDVAQIDFIKSFLDGPEHIDKRSKLFRDFKKQLKATFDLETKVLNKIADEILHLRK